MSNNLTQSASGILSMVTTCHNTAELAKWMVKQPEWKKQKESDLKKKSLGELQNMCTNYFTSVAEVEKNKAKLTELVDVTAQTRPASEEQVTLPTATVTDEELLKLLKEVCFSCCL
ncbi:uncharacterized protein ACA1_372330 [Acanthamoeba castellanii str. Neff]|uniref:Uncharacterized protein n=1 Tax=Acanthamoeba castellanii (strain ATCC 30010 / Neff) TaxID=1257118 RepID=L8GHE0_ACACF|nr:uncharacterized protein ACA1_372330 [Acanthamoeba castellanii str. Neff]ELR12264.1 hypothetical protein ACA1_372330 [Acanthamoeba castellanii str. Neff]